MDRETLRASVRRMVEFTLRGGDLAPASLAAMQEGGRAHRARQEQADATAERPVRWQGVCEGLDAEIQGRVDLLWEKSDPPMVEELKLFSPVDPPPDAPLPAHRMQAVCYGFMLCQELSLSAVGIRVSYVTEAGTVRACFEETMTRQETEDAFFSMLKPLAQWHGLQLAYKVRRDAGLSSLAFPYAAYRPGQREMAAQVYTAIQRRRRLFATLPTGTGKSAAALFPALKALGNDLTRQIFYLTARGTAQLSALDALRRMELPALRSVTITAKEKCCSQSPMRCDPAYCPRAKGYYDRELPALLELCRTDRWTAEEIHRVCEAHMLCPFEFSLALTEISDVVICDYNYIFDPAVSLKRLREPVTLLIDEVHDLPGRVRDMLSGTLDSRELAAVRRDAGKALGRKSAVYKALTALIAALRSADESTLSHLPLDAALEVLIASPLSLDIRPLLQFRMALQRWTAAPENSKPLISAGKKDRSVTLLCLNITDHLEKATRRMTGCVCFSATLFPLSPMRHLMGGGVEDAVFALPSPFPPERLLTLARPLSTRYQHRAESAAEIARSILALYDGKAGKYIAYFPSYAYLALVAEQLAALRPEIPLHVQERSMTEEGRAAFLNRMRKDPGPLLTLCVLGGVFAEGIDLPGSQLIGVAIVGVGLPQVNDAQEALRRYYDGALGDGFAYAYRYPGMQKVVQAAGRLIRSETDAGVVLLVDDRYQEQAYRALLPDQYAPQTVRSAGEIAHRSQEFWRLYGINEGNMSSGG